MTTTIQPDGLRSRTTEWRDPRGFAAEALAVDGLTWLQRMAAGDVQAPIAATMGFEGVEVERGRVVFSAEPGEHLYNPIGLVHGGMAATLLDSAMGCAVHSVLEAGIAYGTIDLSVRYLRPITADAGRITAEGRLVHRGRRIATAEGSITDGAGRLLATGTTSCMLTDLRSG